jgi:uncharacterized membrane protein
VNGYNVAEGPQDFVLVISGDISVGQPKKYFIDVSPTNISFTDTEPVEGEDLGVQVTISNTGNLNALAIDYKIRIDDTETLDSGVITQLDVGEDKVIEKAWTAVRGVHRFSVEIDYMDKILELDENNNTISESIMVYHYEFELNPQETEKNAKPGENVTFKFEVINNGTLSDSYTFVTTDPPDGFNASNEVNSIVLEAGTMEILSLVIRPDDFALADTQAKITLTATSENVSTMSDSFTVKCVVERIAGFDMEVDSTDITVMPGYDAMFYVDLTNQGNDYETVSLMISGVQPGWMAAFPEEILDVDPFFTYETTLSVYPPSEPKAGDYVMLTIVGETDTDLRDEIVVTVTVAEVYNMSVTTTQLETETNPGGSIDFEMYVENIGNTDDTAVFDIELPDDWESAYASDELFVMPYGYDNNYLTIDVPEDTLAGDYTVMLEAYSMSGSMDYLANFTITVEQIHGVELTVEPERQLVEQGKETSFFITVKNTGNGADKFDLTVTGGPNSIKTLFDNRELELEAGASEDVKLTIKPYKTSAGTYYLTVEAVSKLKLQNKASSKIQVVVQEPPPDNNGGKDPKDPINPYIPIDDDNPGTSFLGGQFGLLLLIAAIILVVLIIGGAIAYRKRKKKTDLSQFEDRPPGEDVDRPAWEAGPGPPPAAADQPPGERSLSLTDIDEGEIEKGDVARPPAGPPGPDMGLGPEGDKEMTVSREYSGVEVTTAYDGATAEPAYGEPAPGDPLPPPVPAQTAEPVGEMPPQQQQAPDEPVLERTEHVADTGPAPEPSATVPPEQQPQEQPAPKKKGGEDENLDNMITDLLGKL